MADISEEKRAEIIAQISRLAFFNETFGDVYNLTEQRWGVDIFNFNNLINLRVAISLLFKKLIEIYLNYTEFWSLLTLEWNMKNVEFSSIFVIIFITYC